MSMTSTEKNGTGAGSSAGSTALAVVTSVALAMVSTPSEAEARLHELQDFIRRNMVEGSDYGKIPGTEKDTLLQPGAQKLAEIYGFAVSFDDARPPIERWGDDGSEPLFAYFKRARVTRRADGLFVGEGIGSCNSREEKYNGRWVFERDVPGHLDRSRLRTKSGVGKNRQPYVMFRIPNPALFDLVNTIEKMAAKRALVMAIIAATRSAGIFTQDLEDMAPEARGAKTDRSSVPDGEIVPDDPSPVPVSADVIRERARWAADGGDEKTEAALLGSPDANDRAMVFAWRIGEIQSPEALAVLGLVIENDPHPRMREDMAKRISAKRAEIAGGARGAAAGGGA